MDVSQYIYICVYTSIYCEVELSELEVLLVIKYYTEEYRRNEWSWELCVRLSDYAPEANWNLFFILPWNTHTRPKRDICKRIVIPLGDDC